MNKKDILLFEFLAILFSLAFVYGLSFNDFSQTDFNNGSYTNTTHNGTAVVLSGNNLTGIYTSKIFDAGADARWNNLIWGGSQPSLVSLIAADMNADIWKSVNSGVNWSLIKDDYNNGELNGVTDLEKNSTHLFLVYGQKLWISGDKGLTWSKINDDYNGGEGNNADVLGIDSNNYIYIVEGDQDVWKSMNNGINFSKISVDFNAGNGVVLGLVVNSSGAIFATDVQADVWVSLNQGVNWNLVKDDYNGAIGNSVDDMAIDSSNNLYILDRQDFWRSTDKGVSWTLMNGDINGAGDSNDGLVAYIDRDNVIYVIDGSEDVFKSTNNGTNFINVVLNFNGGNGNVLGVSSFVEYTNLSFQVRNCSSSNCSGGVWQNINLSNLNLTGRYFQYKANFLSPAGGYTPSLASVTLDYNILDNIPPAFSNYTETPTNNSAYVPGQVYTFNATVIDGTAVHQTWIEWQGVNYTNGNIVNSSSVYTFIRDNLAAGTYNYRWWANDSYGNLNNSETRYYVINKATTALSITGTTPVTYGTTSDFAGSGCPAQLTCSLNASNQVYGAGTVVFNYSTLGNENYTANWTLKNLVVDKAENVLTLLSSAGWNYAYGTSTTFSCSATYGAVNLYRDNIEITNPTTVVLGAETYNVKCNITQSQNYTSGIAQGSLTVNKISPQAGLVFDKLSPQSYGNSITPTCSKIIGETNPVLTLNGNTITSGQSLTLEPETYDFNCSLAESQNYTGSSNFSQFTINSASTTTILVANPSSPITYGDANNFSCYNSFGLETILYINGQDKTSENNLDIVRVAGVYTVNCTSIGNQNYTGSSEQTSYTIDQAPGEIGLRLNGIEGDITIDYPQQYNINASTLYGSVSIFKDGVEVTGVNGLNITPTRNAALYNITAVSSGDENHSSVSLTRWLNVTLDVVAPVIILDSPQKEASYGYNTSLPLTFSVSDQHLDSCWYNLASLENISLPGCGNSTFNVSSDGSYVLNLYSNDTLGNLASENATFSILVGAPTIILNSPIGIYLNSENAVFKYVPSDLDLRACELWGDFSGEFALNQTDNFPINDTENLFSLSLPDGTYKWNIRCNDSMGNFAFNGNKTFYVDTSSPQITLTEPVGIKTSRTAIPLTFLVNDNSPTTCWYNIYRGENLEKTNTTLSNCSSASFSVTLDADFTLNLYVSDSAGNFNSINSAFTVTTNTVIPPDEGSSSGGRGGGGGSTGIAKTISKLELSGMSDLTLNKGIKKNIEVNLKNVGTSFLNECTFNSEGEYSSWLSSDFRKNIAAGEKTSFNLEVNVPLNIEPGKYKMEYSLKCQEINEKGSFVVEILEQKIEFGIVEVKRVSNTEIKATYTLEELSGTEQTVEIQFLLMDADGNKIAEMKNVNIISPNSKQDFEILIPVDSFLEGELNLLVNLNSETYSNFVQEDVILGSPISGFSVFGESQASDNLISGFLIFVFLIFAVVMLKRIFNHRKTLKKKK